MNILLNDTIIPKESFTVDIEDRGYQFGDGIYEVIRIYDGKLFEWEAHFKRLVRSAGELKIPLLVEAERLYQNLTLLIKESGVIDGSVYIQVTRGAAPRVHQFPEVADPILLAYVREMNRPTEQLENGVKVILTEDIRWLRVDIKTINLLGNVLAKQKAVEQGANEAILVRDGIVTEGSSSNIFAIKGNECFSHPANHLILNGITRQVVIRFLSAANLIFREIAFTPEELLEMDEAFLTSTGHEVCPIVEINGTMIGKGVPGSYTRKLQSEFNKLLVSLTPQ